MAVRPLQHKIIADAGTGGRRTDTQAFLNGCAVLGNPFLDLAGCNLIGLRGSPQSMAPAMNAPSQSGDRASMVVTSQGIAVAARAKSFLARARPASSSRLKIGQSRPDAHPAIA